MKSIRQTALIMLAGFAGGLVGSAVLNPQALEAAVSRGSFYDVSTYNKQGQRTAFIGPGEAGQGSVFIFDDNGGIRMQAGAYPAGGEKGQSLLGLHDRAEHLRFLLRLHGSNDSPTLVMKDKSGRDRIVIGLDGETQAPYFHYVDQNGAQKNLLQ